MKISKKLKKTNLFKSIYKLSLDGNYIIEIDLDMYEDIFNEWDHAPFKRKDIDPELKIYIEDCSEDIPLKYDIELQFFVPKFHKNEEKEKMVVMGLKNYFDFYLNFINRKMFESRKNAFFYFVIGIIFFLISTFASKFISGGILSKILNEGLFIGFWVFLWEVFDILILSYRKLRREFKEYKRLLDSNIKFVYKE